VALYLRGGDSPAAVRSFSADLIGAACGTVITSVVLIPDCGILWAAAGLIGLKLTSLIVIGMSQRGQGSGIRDQGSNERASPSPRNT